MPRPQFIETAVVVAVWFMLSVNGTCPPPGDLTLDANVTISDCTGELDFTFTSTTPGAVLTIERSDIGQVSFDVGLEGNGIIIKDSIMRKYLVTSAALFQNSFIVIESVFVLQVYTFGNGLLVLGHSELSQSHVHLSNVTVTDGPGGTPPYLMWLGIANDVEVLMNDISVTTSVVNASVGVLVVDDDQGQAPLNRVNVTLTGINVTTMKDTHFLHLVRILDMKAEQCSFELNDVIISTRLVQDVTIHGVRTGFMQINGGVYSDSSFRLRGWDVDLSVGERRHIAMLDFLADPLRVDGLEVQMTDFAIRYNANRSSIFGLRTDEKFPADVSRVNVTVQHWHVSGDIGYGYDLLRWGANTYESTFVVQNVTVKLRNKSEDVTAVRFQGVMNDSVIDLSDFAMHVSKQPLAATPSLADVGRILVSRAWMADLQRLQWENVSFTFRRASLQCPVAPGFPLLAGMFPNQIWVCSYIYASIGVEVIPATVRNSSLAIVDSFFQGESFATNIATGNMTLFMDSSITIDNLTIAKSTALFSFSVFSASDASMLDNVTVTLRNVRGEFGSATHGTAVVYFFLTCTVRNSRIILEDIDVTARTELSAGFTLAMAMLQLADPTALSQALPEGIETVCASTVLGFTHKSVAQNLNFTLLNSNIFMPSWAFARGVHLENADISDSHFDIQNTTIVTMSTAAKSYKHIAPSALVALTAPRWPMSARSADVTVRESRINLDSNTTAGTHVVYFSDAEVSIQPMALVVDACDITLSATVAGTSLVQVQSAAVISKSALIFNNTNATLRSESGGTAGLNFTAGHSFEGCTVTLGNSNISFDSSSDAAMVWVENLTSAAVGMSSSSVDVTDGSAIIFSNPAGSGCLLDSSSAEPNRNIGRIVAQDVTVDGASAVLSGVSESDQLDVVLQDLEARFNTQGPADTVFISLWRPDVANTTTSTLTLRSQNVELHRANRFVRTVAPPDRAAAYVGPVRMPVSTSCTRIPGVALLAPTTAPELDPAGFTFEPLSLAEQLDLCPALTTTSSLTSTIPPSQTISDIRTPTPSKPLTKSVTPLPELAACGNAVFLAWEAPASLEMNGTLLSDQIQFPDSALPQTIEVSSSTLADAGLTLTLRFWLPSENRAVQLGSAAARSVQESIRCQSGSASVGERESEAQCRAYLTRAVAPLTMHDDGTVLLFRLTPGGMNIDSDVEIIVMLPDPSLTCSRSRLDPKHPDSITIHVTAPIPASVELTQQATVATTVAAALSSTSGGGPLGDAQALAAFGLISCASSGDRYTMKSASWLLSPTPIGDGPEGFVLFNLVVTFTCFGIQVTLLGLVYGFKKYIRKSAVVNAAVIQGDLRFPSLFVVFAGVFQQGTSILSLRLLLDGRVSFVALFGAAFSLSFPWAVYVYSRRVARPVFAADISSRLVFFKYVGVGENWRPTIREFLSRWILPVGRWGPPLMRKRFGGPVGACMPLWTLYGAVPPLQALGVSIVASVKTGTMAGCMAQYGVLVVMYLVFGTAIVVIRPYRSMFLNVTAAVSSYALVVTLVLQGMMAADPRRPGGHEGKLAVSVFFTSLSYVRMVYGYWLIVAERFLWRTNASKTFWNENRDSRATSVLFDQLLTVDDSWQAAVSMKHGDAFPSSNESDCELLTVPVEASTVRGL